MTHLRALEGLGEWARENNMKFNKGKCKVLVSPAHTMFWGRGAALLKGAGDPGGSQPNQESAGHLCSNKGKADPGLQPQGNTNRDKSCDHPTLLRLHWSTAQV